jgi:hypothetical protein
MDEHPLLSQQALDGQKNGMVLGQTADRKIDRGALNHLQRTDCAITQQYGSEYLKRCLCTASCGLKSIRNGWRPPNVQSRTQITSSLIRTVGIRLLTGSSVPLLAPRRRVAAASRRTRT